MKSIKSITQALILSAGLLSITSCEKYLDVENPSTLSQDATFASVGYTNSAIVGVYAMLIGDNGYGNRVSCLYPQSADDFKTSGSYSALDRRGISTYGAAATNSELLSPFNQLFRGIERANSCIKYIPLSTKFTSGSETEKAAMRKYLGEALTLRAQFYYELIRNWGDLPAQFVPAADMPTLFIAKTDRDTLYNHLLSDLALAEQYVPWRTESADAGVRLTKGAVKGLRARIALTRGGYSLRMPSSKYGKVMARPDDYKTYYQIAKDECYELMQHREQHTLNPVYENLFKTLNGATRYDDAHEIMFEVGAYGGNASTDSKLGYYNGMRVNSSSSYGGGGGGIIALPTYFYEFDSVGDSRRDITINAFEIDATTKKVANTSVNMTDGKYRRTWTTVTGTSQNLAINWSILRFSDVLLMYAEADNELGNGPSATATAAYEEVRRRAFTNYPNRMGTTPTNKNDFFNAIVQERLLEFGGEGIRKFDLIRWNLLATKLNETKAKLADFKNGVGRYANLPAYIYAKAANFLNTTTAADMATLDLFGGDASKVFFQPGGGTSTAPTGYTTKNWRAGVTDDYISGPLNGFVIMFEPNKKELFPLPQEVINQNYNLTQDFGF